MSCRHSPLCCACSFLRFAPLDELAAWKQKIDMNKAAVMSERKTDRLKAIVGCILLRREKTHLNRTTGAVLVVLPKKVVDTHELDLTDLEQRLYNRLQSDVK